MNWKKQKDPRKTYNARSELTSARRTKNGQPVQGFSEDFAYDPIGNRRSSATYNEKGEAQTSTYQANNLNQYTSRTIPGYAAVRGEADPDATVTVNENPTFRLGEYYFGSDTFDNSTAGGLANLETYAVLASPTNGPDEVSAVTSQVYLAQSPESFAYDDDGNLVSDGRYEYSYDAENRLIGIAPVDPSDGDVAVANVYDHRYRRIEKRVMERRNGAWRHSRTSRFAYDVCNIVREQVEASDGSSRAIMYLWGRDFSGSPYGAGGVGGLLLVESEGEAAVPCFDGNGNVANYVDGCGSLAANYEYDVFGKVVRSSGARAGELRFGFSTKYHDREVGLISYQRRFYHPGVGRWLNRDPIMERGGVGIFVFVLNNPIFVFDTDGRLVMPIIINPDPAQSPASPHEPSPSIIDHFGDSTEPLGEEKWFENNYAGWLAEARRRFAAEINGRIDCKSTTVNEASGRINIYPSDDRGGFTSRQTPGGNEQEYGDAGQSDWSADKVLGSFSIDYVTPVMIHYSSGPKGKRTYSWSTIMYVEDVLGTQEGDLIRKIPGVASITPSRRVRRASWILSGNGECCAK